MKMGRFVIDTHVHVQRHAAGPELKKLVLSLPIGVPSKILPGQGDFRILKVIAREPCVDGKIRRFWREAQLSSRLVHPNTVRLYEEWGFLPPVPRAPNGYRLYDQRHLPRFGEEVAVQPGVIMGEKDAHAGMRMVPADDLLSLVVGIDLVMNIDETVLRKSQINTSLPGVARRQGVLDNDKLLVVLIQAPLTHQNTAHLIFQVADRVYADTTIRRLGHKD